MAKRAVSIAELKEVLAEKEKELAKLGARRTTLAYELEKVEAQIAELQGEAGGRRGVAVEGGLGLPAKAQERKTLRQAVAEVLGATRKALGPKEIAEGLAAVGYVSKSKNLSVMVGQVLSGSPEFRRVGRGNYRLDRRRLRGKAAKKQRKVEAAAVKESESPVSPQ